MEWIKLNASHTRSIPRAQTSTAPKIKSKSCMQCNILNIFHFVLCAMSQLSQLKIAWKCVHAFSRKVADIQTGRQTKQQRWNTTCAIGNVLKYDHKLKIFVLISNALPLCIYDQVQPRNLNWHYACTQTNPVWMIPSHPKMLLWTTSYTEDTFFRLATIFTPQLAHAPLGFYDGVIACRKWAKRSLQQVDIAKKCCRMVCILC